MAVVVVGVVAAVAVAEALAADDRVEDSAAVDALVVAVALPHRHDRAAVLVAGVDPAAGKRVSEVAVSLAAE